MGNAIRSRLPVVHVTPAMQSAIAARSAASDGRWMLLIDDGGPILCGEARGEATQKELSEANDAACEAARDAIYAARDARYAASHVASDVASDVASHAEEAWQTEHLRGRLSATHNLESTP